MDLEVNIKSLLSQNIKLLLAKTLSHYCGRAMFDCNSLPLPVLIDICI